MSRLNARKHVYVTCEICLVQKLAIQRGPFPFGTPGARLTDEHGCPWAAGECPECQATESMKPPKLEKRDCTNCGKRVQNANRFFCRICWGVCDGGPMPVLVASLPARAI